MTERTLVYSDEVYLLDALAVAENLEPLPEADDEDPYRFLAHDGIDHTTGLDTLFQDHHAGVMLNAGFAMMEIDDE